MKKQNSDTQEGQPESPRVGSQFSESTLSLLVSSNLFVDSFLFSPDFKQIMNAQDPNTPGAPQLGSEPSSKSDGLSEPRSITKSSSDPYLLSSKQPAFDLALATSSSSASSPSILSSHSLSPSPSPASSASSKVPPLHLPSLSPRPLNSSTIGSWKITPQDLELQEKLGSGSFGVVYKALWKQQNLQVAIKQIRIQGDQTLQDLLHEITTMSALVSPFICKVYGGVVIDEREVWIVLDYYPKGNLHEFLQSSTTLSWTSQLSFARCAASAINYLHKRASPLLHRDIKSHNFLVKSDTELVLTDFGLSKLKEAVTSRTGTIGTPNWTAPEILKPAPSWTEKADIYSLGMVFYEIVSRDIPYKDEINFYNLQKKIKNRVLPIIPKDCPPQFEEIIRMCWQKDPTRRPTTKQLLDLIQSLSPTPRLSIESQFNTVQPIKSPLIDLGFFNIKFREAMKEHFESNGKEKMCAYVDFLIDITKFKTMFEGHTNLPSKYGITSEIFWQVNMQRKTKLKNKELHVYDPRFGETKAYAQKLVEKYFATESLKYIPCPPKYRIMVNRPLPNRISKTFFDKIQKLAWRTLEAELPAFLDSVECMCYKDFKELTHEILRLEEKLYNLSKQNSNDPIEMQIKQQQKQNLSELLVTKRLAAKRVRPKATYLCGYENFSALNKLWERLPAESFIFSPYDSICYMRVESSDQQEITFGDTACGRVITTYPMLDENFRLGDPICDTFRLYLSESYTIIVAADGCNWGHMPCEAAHNASDQFVEYVREHISSTNNLQQLGQLLLQGIEAAHQAILAPANYKLNFSAPSEVENWDVGITTMVAAVIVQTENKMRYLVCVNVGDCKLLVYREGAVIEVTDGNRGHLTDSRDPGGCLGPQLRLGRPDLRNLSLVTFLCQDDDLVFAITDGIYDNFDPQYLGLPPRNFDMDADDWHTAAVRFSSETLKQKKREFMRTKMQEVIAQQAQASQCDVDPATITTALTQYSINLTNAGRSWMSNNPIQTFPEDYFLFPGKMDHATCICTKVSYTNPLSKFESS